MSDEYESVLPPLRRVNPMSTIDISKAGIENMFDALDAPRVGLWHFSFGAYGSTHVFVWAGPGHTALEDALEEAASWLADNAPGHLSTDEHMQELYDEAREELGDDADEDEIREQAEADMTYTESGYLTSYEWFVNELDAGDELYAEVWEASIDALAEAGDLDDDDIDKANDIADKLGVDAEWEAGDDLEENPDCSNRPPGVPCTDDLKTERTATGWYVSSRGSRYVAGLPSGPFKTEAEARRVGEARLRGVTGHVDRIRR